MTIEDYIDDSTPFYTRDIHGQCTHHATLHEAMAHFFGEEGYRITFFGPNDETINVWKNDDIDNMRASMSYALDASKITFLKVVK